MALCLVISGHLYAADAGQITLVGAEDDLASNILSYLQFVDQPCSSELSVLNALQTQIQQESTTAANALGYYQAQINAVFSQDDECWSLEVSVTPGEPMLLDQVQIKIEEGVRGEEGEASIGGTADNAQTSVFLPVIAAANLVPGSQLNHGTYETLKNNLSAIAVENGYFSARFIQSEILLDLVQNSADIEILFEPGERFLFGPITLDTDKHLADSFILTMLPFAEGDDYSSDDLIEFRQNLDQSLYFEQISINPQLGNAVDREVPINITLATRPRNAFSGGVGYTTDTGPRIKLAYDNRYVTSTGHRFDSDGAFSSIRSQLDATYSIPLRNPVRESLNFSVGVLHEDNDTFKSDLFKLEASYHNESANAWTREIYVDYLLDDYEAGLEEDESIMTVLGMNLSKTEADNLINPTVGWKLFLQVRGASDSVISDASFAQIFASAKRIDGIGARGRFLYRAEIGSTLVDGIQQLPVSLRFFTGGDQSIRGYNYQSVTPLDNEGNAIGGKNILVASIEYDYLFLPKWRAAIFYDGGSTFSETKDIEWSHSLGFGIRWVSPIGPIRLDIAHGFEDDKALRFHITMGPDL